MADLPPGEATAGSQFQQDTFLDEWVFEGRRNGVFLDLGAYDGVTGSNTLWFERARGWRGLLVEPVAALCAKAAQVRRNPCVQVAAAGHDGTSDFLEVLAGFRQMGGLADTYPVSMRRALRSHPGHDEVRRPVAVESPRRLIDRLAASHVDFVSIDIEGAERAVLAAWPFDEVTVDAWCIENNSADSGVEQLLTERGFAIVRRLGADDIYVTSDRVEELRRAADLDDFDEAVDLLDAGFAARAARRFAELLEADPDDPDVWTNLGIAHRAAGDLTAAVDAQRRAMRLAPERDSIRRNGQRALLDAGHCRDVVALASQVVDPTEADEILAVRGAVELAVAERRFDDAVVATERWQRFGGHADRARVERATLRLGAGDVERGFDDYEARRSVIDGFPALNRPEWQGESLAGRHLLVVGEQGLGDHVMFARYLPVLRRFEPASVTVACSGPVRRLIAGIEGVDAAVAPDPAAIDTPVDVWVPFGSIPKCVGPPVPAPARPVLPADSIERARALVTGDLRIGVVWSGSDRIAALRRRHLPIDSLVPLFDRVEASWYSLAKDAPDLDRAVELESSLVDVASTDRDLADTAAVCAELDLVITVCTVTAHLAPAAGTPTWVMLHDRAFWAWEPWSASSSWYPEVRQFAQPSLGDWASVVDEVADALAVWVDERADAR